VENRDIRLNMNKTKFTIRGEWQKVMQKAVRWPCGVCSTGVGNNSIHWVTLSLVNTKDLYQSLKPNYRFNT